MENVKCLNILHFNDVYNVEELSVEPIAGAARFTTALKAHGSDNESIVLFSGDCLNPSLLSVTTRGKHMPPIMNEMNIKCSLFGNHEFDFGIDRLEKRVRACTFPWVNSNMYDLETESLLLTNRPYEIIEHQGLKIGIVGLVEHEWVDTVPCFMSSNIEILDFCKVGRQLALELKSDVHSCHLVVALTHMRWPNDRLLAAQVPEIDIILGGHDHDYHFEWVECHTPTPTRRMILKSGSDFRTFTHLRLTYNMSLRAIQNVSLEKVVISSYWEPDAKVVSIISEYTRMMDRTLNKVIGYIDAPLDTRYSSVRTRETNVGNFVCDTILTTVDADVVIVNSGTIRADRLFPPGPFKLKDLRSILPFLDQLVLILVTGEQLIEALENAVSSYPKYEGRFPLVGGMRFAFDPSKPVGKRVLTDRLFVQNKPIDLTAKYKLCVKRYLANGNDGYRVFVNCPLLLDEEACPILATLIQNHFRTIHVLKKFEKCRIRHRQSIVTIAERHRILEEAGSPTSPKLGTNPTERWDRAKWFLIEQKERQSAHAIAPMVDGRIEIVGVDSNST